jgi:PPM family protein phosphatase
VTGPQASCPRCATYVHGADRFCGNCGAILAEFLRIAIPRDTGPREGSPGPCPDCGNSTYVDGYCTACGNRRAEPDRDEARVGAVSLITDRGLEHARNEDAAAAGMLSGKDSHRPHAIAVALCDGVSTSGAAHLASAAAAAAGLDAMLATLAAARPARAAVFAGLAAAATAAASAGADTDPSNAPSCTYVAAAVVPNPEGSVQITVGNVGDSRAYWLPEPPAEGRQLTVDHSVAQELITAGAAAQSEAVQRGAHVLTRWLGGDSEPTPWSESSVCEVTVNGPGSLVMCTDGLWNYLPNAVDLTPFCTGAGSDGAAHALIDHALSAGGHDNVTVAVLPIGGLHEFD